MRPVATRRGAALLVAGVLALTGCTGGGQEGSAEGDGAAPSSSEPTRPPGRAAPSPTDDPAPL